MRRPRLRGTLALLTGALGVLAVAAGSRIPFRTSAPDAALLRLSWRMEGVRVEECRVLSEEELEDLPAHMRPPESCESRGLPYLLAVDVDDRAAVRDTVVPGGRRGSGPLYVQKEVPLTAGPHEVEVRFVPLHPRPDRDGGDEEEDEEEHDEEDEEEGGREAEAGEAGGIGRGRPTARRLRLETTVEPGRREVLLVTHDPEESRLVVRRPRY